MRLSPKWFVAGASLLATFVGVNLHAQSYQDPPVALTLDATVGGRAGLSTGTTGLGLSVRAKVTDKTSFRVLAGYAVIPAPHGSSVCMESYPCGSKDLRDEWRVGADIRRRIASTAFFVQSSLGVAWPHVTGGVYRSDADRYAGFRGTVSPLGFGQIGVGRRARTASHGRWVEMGIEKDAATPKAAVYIRAAFGIV